MGILYEKCRCSTNRIDDHYVGIRFENNDIKIIFPLGFHIPDNDKEIRKNVLLMHKSFSLLESQEKEFAESGEFFKNDFVFPIDSYFWLIKDFFTNGLYKRRERIIKQNSNGKINWKKTIQQETPVLANGSFVYLEPYYELTRNSDTIITEIEKYCLNTADLFFSWMFGRIRVDKSLFSYKDRDYMLSILKKNLMISFGDYEKMFLTHMINILTGLDEKTHKTKAYSYGTENYKSVWEKLIKKVFGNVENIDDYYPEAEWNLVPIRKKSKTVPLRPDAIYYDKVTNKYYILDAKYYGYYLTEENGRLPSTSDIEKQIVYGQSIHFSKDVGGRDIFNAMIMPYDSHIEWHGFKDKILFLGYANADWTSSTFPYENILLILADTSYVMNKWRTDSSKDVKTLIEIIETNTVNNLFYN